MVPGTPDQEPVRLQFPNTDISAVLQFYEQLTNKHVITDNAVQGTINININKPVSRDEAIRIIETCLYLNGFSFASDESGNILKLVGNGKNPRSYGINIYSDATQIPDNVSIVSVLFQLQYADSKEIKQLIDQYLTGASSPYSSSVPLPGALLITESAGMLRNIAKVIAAADVPPAEVVSRFYALQRASAKDVVDKMNKLFDKQAGAPGGAEPAAAPPPGHPGVTFAGHTGTASLANVLALRASVTGLSEDSIIVGKIKLDFDERTNRVHVVTRPVNLHFVEDLIAQFDSDIQFGEPSKRALKYVSASDVLDVVVKAITEPGTKNDGTDTSASTTSRNNTQPTNGTTNGNSSNGNSSGSGSSGSGINITEGLSTEPVDTTPKAVTVGSTKIIADPRENTIIVLGNDEVKRKIFLLLDQLDVRAPQVMISAVIGEFTLTNDSQVGIDYLLHYPSGGLVSLLGSGSSGGTGVLSALSGNHGFGLSNFSNSGVTNAIASGLGAGTGFTAAIGAANSLDVIVSALESTGRFRITNRPFVYTSNNKKAIIVSGEQIAIPTNTLSNLTSSGGVNSSTAAVQSSVGYEQVALHLEVVPLINSDREIQLDCLVQLDSPASTSATIGGSSVPNIDTRYLRNNITLPNGATMVLGGLITRTVGGNDSHIPLLGRIPVIGYLFGNKAKQNDRSELVILLRPVVTTSPLEMAQESHIERNRLLIEPDVDTTIAKPTPAGRRLHFRYQDDKDPQ